MLIGFGGRSSVTFPEHSCVVVEEESDLGQSRMELKQRNLKVQSTFMRSCVLKRNQWQESQGALTQSSFAKL